MNKLIGKIIAFMTVFLLLGAFANLSVSAQTKKKKSARTRKPAVRLKRVSQTVPQQTLPVILSQADQDQSQQIITGNTDVPTETQTDAQTEIQPATYDERLTKINNRVKEMNTRMKSLESTKPGTYEEKQKRLLMNLDILTRAETRAESLRKQLFELIEKENTIKTKLETIDVDLRPDMIDRQVAFTGSLKPEELREMRQKNLEAEKRNLSNLLIEIQTTRTSLESSVSKADQLVEKLHAVLEKDIDDALAADPQ